MIAASGQDEVMNRTLTDLRSRRGSSGRPFFSPRGEDGRRRDYEDADTGLESAIYKRMKKGVCIG